MYLRFPAPNYWHMKTRFVVDLQQKPILKIQLVAEWEIPKTLQTRHTKGSRTLEEA